MLNIGDKIYYVDYEESKSSYTIVRIENLKNEEYMRDGIWYIVHADNLSSLMGYYPLYTEEVDKKPDELGRFFSTPDKAHETFMRYKQL